MAPFTLIAHRETKEFPASIEAYTRSGKHKMATLRGDGSISFNPEIEYDFEEIAVLQSLQKSFFTIFNSLIEKEEEIRKLKNTTPIFDRYSTKL